MSSKGKSQRKQHLQMQEPSSPRNALVNPVTGLRKDEIAFGIDPEEPGKAKRYVMPDGRHAPLNSGAPKVLTYPLGIQETKIIPSSTVRRVRLSYIRAEAHASSSECQHRLSSFGSGVGIYLNSASYGG